LAGCGFEQRDWKAAQQAGTVEGYEAFLAKRPKSQHAEAAIGEVWKLMFEQGTVEACESFLEKHPDSALADTALKECWRLTVEQQSLDACETFLGKHAGSPLAATALATIWQLTGKTTTIAPYETFLQRHPDPPYGEKALAGIWKLTAAKKSIQACREFLWKHPDSSLGKVVEQEIARLFTQVTPAPPACTLNSNLSVSLNWDEVAGAEAYKVYWSRGSSGTRGAASMKTSATSIEEHWPGRLPVYYRVVAIRGSATSKPSKPCRAAVLSSQGGRRCQICGAASAGYCHQRDIYVCSEDSYYTSREGTSWRCP